MLPMKYLVGTYYVSIIVPDTDDIEALMVIGKWFDNDRLYSVVVMVVFNHKFNYFMLKVERYPLGELSNVFFLFENYYKGKLYSSHTNF